MQLYQNKKKKKKKQKNKKNKKKKKVECSMRSFLKQKKNLLAPNVSPFSSFSRQPGGWQEARGPTHLAPQGVTREAAKPVAAPVAFFEKHDKNI